MFRPSIKTIISSGRRSLSSICQEGQSLHLKVKKAGADPVLLLDDLYPPWLWNLLDLDHQQQQILLDPIRAAKKLLRKLNIAKIKLNNFSAKLAS